LSWIIHLMGDLYQRLHAAGRDHEEAGNIFHVTYMKLEWCGSPAKTDAQPHMNVHKVRDVCRVLTLMVEQMRQQLSDEIVGTSTTYKGHQFADKLRRDWAKESHIAARTFAYAEIEQDDNIGPNDEYLKRALPIVKEQLLKAGIRLAKTIDQDIEKQS